MTGHLLLALALAGSQSLGYESPYLGVRAEARVSSGSFVGMAQAGFYDADKRETGDGYGIRAKALAGFRATRNLTLLGGVAYSRQATSAWEKEGYAPTIQVELQDDLGTLIGSVERLESSDDKQTVAALEARMGRKYPAFARCEYVEYKTLFAEGHGERYEIGFMIPLWER